MKKLILFQAIITVLFLVVLEFGLRAAFFRSLDFDIEMWKYARQLKQVASSGEVAHEHVPGGSAFLMGAEVSINSKKLRDREFAYEKASGVTRILMLGDSLTFGWGVTQDATTAKLLEVRLNDGSGPRKVEVINSGVGNYNTAQEVAYFLTEGFKYQPDIVVLNYFINDAEETPRPGGFGPLRWSYAYTFVTARLDTFRRQFLGAQDWRSYYADLYGDDAPGWRQAARRIGDLLRYCRSHNIAVVVTHYPELHALEPYPFQMATNKLRAVVESHGGEMLDLLPYVKDLEPSTLWVTPSDAHPNRAANERFAEGIRIFLKDRFGL